MFEYKSEVLSVTKASKGFKIVKTIVDHVEVEKLDDLINTQAEEGWELVTHSSMVDTVTGSVNMVVTFRKPKS